MNDDLEDDRFGFRRNNRTRERLYCAQECRKQANVYNSVCQPGKSFRQRKLGKVI